MRKASKYLLLAATAVMVAACTKPAAPGSGMSAGPGESFKQRSDCGVVINNKISNPPQSSLGEQARIDRVIDAEFIILNLLGANGGKVLVKQIGIQPAGKGGVDAYIKRTVGYETVTFFNAGDGCTVPMDGGQRGLVGTIVRADGSVLAEQLLSKGYAGVDSLQGYCGSQLVENCYSGIEPSAPEYNNQVINYFVWKPVSDSDGNAAVTFNPTAAKIVVNGETFRMIGAGNGRATAARGSRPGCAYGRVTISVYDDEGRIIQFPGGKDQFIVENGCRRVEF